LLDTIDGHDFAVLNEHTDRSAADTLDPHLYIGLLGHLRDERETLLVEERAVVQQHDAQLWVLGDRDRERHANALSRRHLCERHALVEHFAVAEAELLSGIFALAMATCFAFARASICAVKFCDVE
jgi:hypothetical protein